MHRGEKPAVSWPTALASWNPAQLALNIQVTGNMLGLFLGEQGDGLEDHYDLVKEVLLTELPEGWSRGLDSEGKVYYFNVDDGITQWEHPLLFMFRKRAANLLHFSSASSSPSSSPSHARRKQSRRNGAHGKSVTKKRSSKKKRGGNGKGRHTERASHGDPKQPLEKTLLRTYTSGGSPMRVLNDDAYRAVSTVETYVKEEGKSSSRRVQEAIRVRLNELNKTKGKCERMAHTLGSASTRIATALGQLSGILKKCETATFAAESRIESLNELAHRASRADHASRDEAANAEMQQFVKDSIGESLLSCLVRECVHWRDLASKLRKLLLYGKECESYQDNLQGRFLREIEHTSTLLEIERKCLAIDSRGSESTAGKKKKSVKRNNMRGKQPSQSRLSGDTQELKADRLSLVQLEEHAQGALEVSHDFFQRQKQLLAECESDTGVRRRQVLMAARNAVRQSFQICEHIQTDILGNERAMRLLHTKQKDVKLALQQTLKPLVVCQRRYEMHMVAFQAKQGGASFALDETSVEQELVRELKGLQMKVFQLKQQLDSTLRELELLDDVQMQLEAQLEYEHDLMRFASACLTRLGYRGEIVPSEQEHGRRKSSSSLHLFQKGPAASLASKKTVSKGGPKRPKSARHKTSRKQEDLLKKKRIHQAYR